MRECLVGLCHAVGVFALADRGATVLGGVHELVRQAERHGLLAALARGLDEPAHGQRLAALRAHRLQSFVEIVEVPAAIPRTKPKALSYALPMISGDFLVLYDAEDRPHPLQLIEAWQRFRGAHLA